VTGTIEHLDQIGMLSVTIGFLGQIVPINIDGGSFLGSGGNDRLGLGKKSSIEIRLENSLGNKVDQNRRAAQKQTESDQQAQGKIRTD
jgi:hypothetical protein